MRLPNGRRAVVDIERLRSYTLNPDHEEGQHKARVFQSVFGIGAERAGILRAALVECAKSSHAVETSNDPYGRRYRIDFELVLNGRRAIVRSAWILGAGSRVPRFLSCWVLLESVTDV